MERTEVISGFHFLRLVLLATIRWVEKTYPCGEKVYVHPEKLITECVGQEGIA